MPDLHSEIEAVTVVLIGHFNPRIFQPAWLANHGLIRPEEAEQAENLVSTAELTTFSAKWLTVQVTSDRFQAVANDSGHFEALRDLVLGTFSLLEHTPFSKMGLNREFHIKMPSKERYVDLGHLLVPKERWKSFLDDPVTQSVTVSGLLTRGELRPALNVKVEPSKRVELGIFISTNEHYEIGEKDPPQKLMEILREQWGNAMIAANKIAENLTQLT